MASLDSEIIIKQELRPCLVNDKKALFHRWNHIQSLTKQEYTLGLIEYEDGSLDEVYHTHIKFIDNKIKEFCFEEQPHFQEIHRPIKDKIQELNELAANNYDMEPIYNKSDVLLFAKNVLEEVLKEMR